MKVIGLVLICFLVAGMAFADRTDDLTKENQQLNQQITQRQNEITQLTQLIIENIGRMKELNRIKEENK